MPAPPRFRMYGGFSKYRRALGDALAGRIDAGDAVAELERRIERDLGRPHAIATPQGRVAMYLLIKHTIAPGQAVVMSPYTIHDIVNMVINAGGRPVFADIRRDTCNLDPAALRAALGPDTGAVIVTHLHGVVSDLGEIAEICRDHGVPLIEDAAQAFGAVHDGRPVGAVGDAAILSFGRAKNVNAFMGGMAVTRDDRVAEAVRAEIAAWPPMPTAKLIKRVVSCAVFDLATRPPVFPLLTYWAFRAGTLYDIEAVNKVVQTENNPTRRPAFPDGFAARMTQTQARIVLEQLDGVAADTAERQQIAAVYAEALSGAPGLTVPPAGVENVALAYPVQVADRRAMLKRLARAGFDVAIQHIHNTADLPCFAEFKADCPVAREVAARVILLPTWPGYGVGTARRLAEAVRSA